MRPVLTVHFAEAIHDPKSSRLLGGHRLRWPCLCHVRRRRWRLTLTTHASRRRRQGWRHRRVSHWGTAGGAGRCVDAEHKTQCRRTATAMGVTAVGAMSAFPPHGIGLAVPVTITVRFDPALVPETCPVVVGTRAFAASANYSVARYAANGVWAPALASAARRRSISISSPKSLRTCWCKPTSRLSSAYPHNGSFGKPTAWPTEPASTQ